MNIGVVLPHTKLFGGIKRFFELGNFFVERGHEFTVYTPDAENPEWFDFVGKIDFLKNINKTELDFLFFVETAALDVVVEAKAKHKIFYHVIERAILKKVLAHDEIEIFANSTNIYNFVKRRYGVESFKAFGGVNTKKFTSEKRKQSDTINIMAYGRLSRKRKGTHLVIRACERLYKKYKNIKLILFDTATDAESMKEINDFDCKLPFEFITNYPVRDNNDLYHKADIFVSGEKRAGWSNTTAEAMAAGLSIVSTKSGTIDFLIHNKTGILVRRNSFSIGRGIKKLIVSEDLRNKLSENGRKEVEKFEWEILADKILEYFKTKLKK